MPTLKRWSGTEWVPVGSDTFLTQADAEKNYVRFVDQSGDPLPAGSVTTIHVNTVTGEIDDITFEEA